VCAPDAATLAARLDQVGHALAREVQVAPAIEALTA
jgi:hypothetical protein